MGGIIGLDVGGTFTDLFYSADGMSSSRVLEVPATPSDPSEGLLEALRAAGVEPDSLDATRRRANATSTSAPSAGSRRKAPTAR